MADTAPLGTRTDGVEGGVGLTALLVAAARAIETHRPDALAQDIYAEHFVLGARASAHWPVRLDRAPGGDTSPLWGRFARYFGLRTRVLDDFLLRSVRSADIRQVVLLGAGLDARAFRLDWPSDCVIFEIDRDGVLAFKHRVLDTLSAEPGARRVPIGTDLRADWAGALTATGFDATAPTAWLVEGLLFYLPHAAETALIDTVDRLSAPGSALAYEVKLEKDLMAYRDSPLYVSTRRQLGIDLLDLFSREPRPDSAARLRDRGWTASVHTPFDFTRRHGRGPLPEENDALAGNRWVFADRARPA
ncbi:class I SAM-dependent methyltransferase [Streptomyces anthocyanicus]|uniref:class I SAM-dependent methyltransferase n=1 Tax=Streptomyces anthocyanicus TaxID=68174 RepID=UPI002DD82FDD|nr:class I SAM-dependent methyltransferase [Streptomyces anthocyanicus]WSB59861.1 class I SAM-dependent methyltransferase [Streptomyces anthocyanicus]